MVDDKQIKSKVLMTDSTPFGDQDVNPSGEAVKQVPSPTENWLTATEIKAYEFSFCDGIQSIAIPPNVTRIAPFAFWFCSSMTSITIPYGVEEIGAFAFCGALLAAAIIL